MSTAALALVDVGMIKGVRLLETGMTKPGDRMNRLFFMMGLLFIFIIPQAWGSTSPYPNPYRQTMWNNLTDAVHTFGQNTQQTRTTLWKLHNARTRARLNSINQANQAKLKAQRQAWLNSGNNL